MITTSRPETHPVDQIAKIVEADHWDWDTLAAMQGVADLDDAGQAVLGLLFKHWTLHCEDPKDYPGLVGPLGSLVDMVYAYAKTGDDPEIKARLAVAVSEEHHPDAIRRMAELEADEWRAAGNLEMAAEVLRSWGVADAAELAKGGAV